MSPSAGASAPRVESGLMLLAPLGVGGGAIKINPPIIITEEAFQEGLAVLADAVRALTA